MLTAGLSLPEIAESKVLMSGMLASTVPTGWVARFLKVGSACLKASQPGPCGSGISATGVGSAGGSAYAVTASGTDAAIAAIAAVAPSALLVRVFTCGFLSLLLSGPSSAVNW